MYDHGLCPGNARLAVPHLGRYSLPNAIARVLHSADRRQRLPDEDNPGRRLRARSRSRQRKVHAQRALSLDGGRHRPGDEELGATSEGGRWHPLPGGPIGYPEGQLKNPDRALYPGRGKGPRHMETLFDPTGQRSQLDAGNNAPRFNPARAWAVLIYKWGA